MYCPKCGTEISDNSNFCTSCGHSFNNQNNLQFNYSDQIYQVGNFLLDIFKSPINCCKKYSEKLSAKFTYIYFGATALIISLISALFFKGFIKSIFSSLYDILYAIEGYSLSYSESIEISSYLDTILKNAFPFFNILLLVLITVVLFFAGLSLLDYLFNTVILKNQVPLKNYFVVSSVAMTLQGAALIIYFLFSLLAPIIGLLLLSVSNIAIVLILYSGVSSIRESTKAEPYVFSIIYTIVSFLTSFIAIFMVVIYVISSFGNLIYQIM